MISNFKKRWCSGAVMVFAIAFCFVSNSRAVNYYVNDVMDGGEKWCLNAGSDASNGLTITSPKATITNLLSTKILGPNDVVYIDSGYYNGLVTITSADSGNPSGYVTFQGAGTRTVLNGSGGNPYGDGSITARGAKYLIFKNLDFKNTVNKCFGLFIKSSKNIIAISNFAISNSSSGIRIEDSTNCTAVGNICNYNNRTRDQWPAGIQLAQTSRLNLVMNNICTSNARGIFLENTCTSNTITGNVAASNSESGITIGDNKTENSKLQNNIFTSNRMYANAMAGLWFKGAGYNMIAYNLVYNNPLDGMIFENATNGAPLVKNCVSYNNGANGLNLKSGSLSVKNSIALNNGGYGYLQTAGILSVTYSDAFGNYSGDYGSFTPSSSISLDPLFVSLFPTSSDFFRLSRGSPCIDSGDPSDPVPANGGSCIDMGAFEYIFPFVPSGNLVIYNNYLNADHPQAKIYINNPANTQSQITLRVYTTYGQLVKDLADAKLSDIIQPVVWDGKDDKGNDVSSGVYIIHAKGYKYDEQKRIYVVR